MRPADGSNNTGPYVAPYVCSSVDLLPFIYSLVLGNHSWRQNNNDMVYYLRNREAIEDAIFGYTSLPGIQQRRISGIPVNNNGACSPSCQPWQEYQPYVLHTADDYSFTVQNPQEPGPAPHYQPTHIVAYRTIDFTNVNNNSAPFFPYSSYGGGKLAEYGYWDTKDQTSSPIVPINNSNVNGNNAANQYEFYNYSPNLGAGSLNANPQEIGNQYFDASLAVTAEGQAYLTDFNTSGVQAELYSLNSSGGGNNTLQVVAAVQQAWTDYKSYLTSIQYLAGNDGRPYHPAPAANNAYGGWDQIFDPI